ncbi:hypothetical protein RJ640_012798, partial [Escallonia rubra]
SSAAEKPPLEAIRQSKKLDQQETRIISSSEFASQLDATTGSIPIINPTTPSTNTPIVNPVYPPPPSTTTSPIVNPGSPQPPTTTSPIINPGSPPPPTTTSPIINPGSPPPPTATTTTPTPASSGGSWCIASPTASETALQVALDYACGYGGADCSAIQPGASCYNPITLRDHASYAFNDYYQKNPAPTSCAFGGTAQLTSTDPSSGSCKFSTPKSTTSISPPMNPIPTTPSAPTTYGTTPSTPTIYSEPTGYGSEPTATPSSADSISCNLLLLFTTACLIVSLVAANHI